MQKKINVAIAGVGNCASALVQGVEYYRHHQGPAIEGVMRPFIGSYSCADVAFVAAFDIDRRKIGRPLEEAIFAKPNCTRIFQSALPVSNVIVQAGPVFDGVAAHMTDYPDDAAFRSANLEPTNIAEALRASGAEVLLCYLPVGSEQAVKHYAQACLDAGVAMINCVPVFLASDPEWAQKFRDSGLPIVGDDIKSQVGATMVHRALVRLFADRGVGLDRTYQLNTGGNTDFLNMLERNRLKSKKISKTEAVQSQLDEQLEARNIHIGPSDYVPWQLDNKICFIRMEGRGFGDAPIELELRLSVQDSPNSAGVVIDAIRCAKLGLERGEAGPLMAPSAYYMKRPPRQFRDSVARDACDAFIDGRAFDLPEELPRDTNASILPGRV
jgi:myo-inositol-1-phosphate synthase